MMAGIKQSFSTFLKDLSIKQKLLLSYLVLIIIPLGILALLTYNRSSEIVSNKMIDMNTQALDQINTALEYTFQYAIKSSNIVIANKDIQEVLLKDPVGYETDKQISDFRKLSDYFDSIQFDQNVYRIRLYIKDGLYYASENNNFFNIKTIDNSVFYKKAIDYNGQIYWTPPYSFKYAGIDSEKKIISGIRMINNHSAYGEFIGLVSVDIPVRDIQDTLGKTSIGKDGLVYLVNEENQIITYSDEKLMQEGYRALESSSVLPEAQSVWKKAKIEGQEVLVCYKNFRYTGWKLAMIIPLSSVLKSSIDLRNYTFVLMISIGLVAYLLALLISNSTVKRIRRLIKTMRKAERGEFSIKAEVDGKDEIGDLETSFNHMLMKIEGLVDEKFKMGIEVKNAELKALQAQINPHFLYNTLELITCKALKYKARDITELVKSMAQFYRLSLSRGRDIVSIGDEIAHIETYVFIQNQRFDESIKLEVKLDESIPTCSIPKLVLQPLVENAIIHGIMEKETQSGTIYINGRFYGDDILLQVIDDGVGIAEEKVKNMLNVNNGRDNLGYGVKNVNQRLKINYGEQYGLTYRSIKGQGTTVELRIPAIRDEH